MIEDERSDAGDPEPRRQAAFAEQVSYVFVIRVLLECMLEDRDHASPNAGWQIPRVASVPAAAYWQRTGQQIMYRLVMIYYQRTVGSTSSTGS